MKKKWFVFLLIIMVSISQVACGDQVGTRYEATFLELFDTVTTIVGYASDKDEFTNYSQMIYDYLEEYNQKFDIYNNYEGINNIKTINDYAGVEPVEVDQDIIDLLLFSKEMYEKTDGKVNIAFGSVLSLWHDHRTEGLDDPENASVPNMEELQELARHTNIDDVIIDETAGTVYLADPEMRLDVGAIAKGYSVEKVTQKMEEAGFLHGMISVGGNVRTIGTKYDESGSELPWGVGIQNPDLTSLETSLCTLSLSDLSLVTSGVYERYYVVDGERYHHIINPDTLMPAAYFVSVSIICEDSGLADGLSTAVFNMPFDQGSALIESLDEVEALWVYEDGTQVESSGFSSLLKK